MDMKKFNDILDDYVQVMQEIAITNERAEAGYDISIWEYEENVKYYQNKMNKHQIKYFKLNEDYDINDIEEYCIYLENKISEELLQKIQFMVQYNK